MRARGAVSMLMSMMLGLGVMITSAGAQSIEPDAEKILRAATSYLAGLETFTADYDVDTEVVDATGQKLQYSASGSIAVERPGKAHITRKGAFIDAELIFDGKMLSLFGKKANVYAQIESPTSDIDGAVAELRAATGIDAPAADFLVADPYAALADEVERGVHVGTGVIGGVECDHLAFRNPRVDWQIWIQKGDRPLPLKYVITTKWIAGAPQYALRFRNWDVAPALDAKTFSFSPPADAKRLEQVHADAIGELSEVEQ
jgi:hypothetical protein